MYVIEKNYGSRVIIEGREFVYFGGTNYLGISHNDYLLNGIQHVFDEYGFSPCASRITTGENVLYKTVEEKIMRTFLSEDACLISCGYLSNTAATEAISDVVDIWFVDEYAHPSFLNGLDKRKIHFYKHLNSDSLSSLVNQFKGSCYAVLTDAVFSLRGEAVEIKNIINAMDLSKNFLILDESHSIGVLGSTGLGILENERAIAQSRNIIRTGTFSKSFGAFGGFVLATNEMIELVRAKSNAYKACTHLPSIVCHAILNSIEVFNTGGLQKKLNSNMAMMLSLLSELKFEFKKNGVPIFTLSENLPECSLRELHKYFYDNSLLVPFLDNYYDTVSPEGLLRWTVSALHEPSDFEQFHRILKSIVKDPRQTRQ